MMVPRSKVAPKSFLTKKYEKKLFENSDKLSSRTLGHILGVGWGGAAAGSSAPGC